MADFLRKLTDRFRARPARDDSGVPAQEAAVPPKKKKRIGRRMVKRIVQLVLTVFLVGIIAVCIVGTVLVVYVFNNFDAEEYLPELGKLSMDSRSVIYVKNDAGEFEPYQNLLGGTSVWKDLDKIPKDMQNALISIEDERFYDHEGVDWKRTVGAFANLFLNRVFHMGSTEYGGSTITQQLIRVTTQNTDHTIQRKINEILAAIELEKNESTKHQVLEAYLNNLPLTGDLVGVGIGARYYFGKEVEDLDLAQCAAIVGITNNPGTYNPYTHPENVRQRQRIVLAKMYELGHITKDEYIAAYNEELVFKSSAVHQTVQDYYVDLVVEDVIRDLMDEYGYTYNYANNMVFYGGLNIYSAEDPKIQERVEAIYRDDGNFPAHRADDAEDPQTGFFAVDYTGRVMATVGGRGTKDANRVFNRSTQATRSPGSSFKPLASYGPAIAMDVVHYSSVMRDAPILLPNGTKWPHNYEARSTPDNGDVLLGVALQKSLNTVAARLVQTITPQRSYEYATNIFGLSTLVYSKAVNGQIMSDINLAPMALGALTDGVTVREMAAAYSVYGSGGYYNKPYTYYSVTRGLGDDESTLLTGGQKSTIVLDAQSAYVMVSLMQRVTTRGTAAGLARSWPGWQVYGKTGTSESERDVYFSGGTAYYAAASWFGYDNNQKLKKNQTGYAQSLWNKSMLALHKGLSPKEFEQPSGIEVLEYCTETGQLATENCKNHEKGVYKTTNKPGFCEKHPASPVDPNAPTTAATTTTTTTAAQQ